ncbi:MAG: LVIVD repeat-containing protein [Candidatus Heimdallarchaeota archaeon]
MLQVNKNKKFLFFIILFIIIITNINNINNNISKLTTQGESSIQSLNNINTASDQTNYSLSKINQYDDQLGAMNDVEIKGNFAYVAVQWGGLVIFDISDLENPFIIGSYYDPINTSSVSTNELTFGVFVKDDVAFVADGRNGLLILNVSNPENPIKITHFDALGYWDVYIDVCVANNYAYILSSSDSLSILNISIIDQPYKISDIEYIGSQFTNVQIKNDLVYLDGVSLSKIVNVSNPLNPELLLSLNNTQIFALQEDYLFTVDYYNNLIIYDASSLPLLTVITNYSLTINGSAKYLCVNEEYAYIGSTEEIIVVDIQELINPQEISKISQLNWFYQEDFIWITRRLVTFNEPNKRDILLFIDYQRGLFIHKTSNIPGNTLLSFYDGGMRAELVRVKGKFLYVASRVEFPYYPARLDIFALKDDSLIRKGTYYTDFNINDLIIGDDIALLVSAISVEIVDISDPKNPTKITNYNYPVPTFVWNLYYDPQQELIYLCCDIEGLVILDASNLQNLTVLSVVKDFQGYGYRAYDVYVSNGVAFVADVQMFGGFGIIDVSDPSNPIIITYAPLNRGIMGIYTKDGFAYLTSSTRVLEIFNVTILTEPVKIGEYDENEHGDSNGHFFLLGDIYFVARMQSFTLVNVSNPVAPQEVTTINRPLSAFYLDVFVANSLLFIASAWDGLEIWQLPINSQSKMIEILFYIIFSVYIFVFFFVIILVFNKNKKEGVYKVKY